MTEPLTAEELAKQRSSHKPTGNYIGGKEYCYCNRPYPCFEMRLLATIDARDAEIARLREALEQTRRGMLKAAEHAVKFDNAVLHKVAFAWLGQYATRDGRSLLPSEQFPALEARDE